MTGAAGFVGSNLCEFLIEKGLRVLGIDNFMDYYPRSIKESNLTYLRKHANFELVDASLLEVDLTKLLDEVDGIFHQAAQAGVRASWGKSFKVYTDNNVLATQMLLEASRERQIKKFIYASSSSIYGDTTDLPMRESSLPRPVSPYGVSKLAAEHLCWLYYKNFGVPAVSLRYFTVYGARQRPDMAFHRFFRWAFDNQPLEVYGNGMQSRDFTHVDDIAKANWLAYENAPPGEVYNIGGGSRVTLNEAIDAIRDITGMDLKVGRQAKQKGDVRHTMADISKAEKELGYEPEVSIRDGLLTEYNWIKDLVKRLSG